MCGSWTQNRTQLRVCAQLNDAKLVAAENIEELQKMSVRRTLHKRSVLPAQFSALGSFLLLYILLRCRSCRSHPPLNHRLHHRPQEKTKEMENNAMDFGAMAKQMRQQQEKKSKFGF